jgi:serine/threonine-protein kinase
MQDGSAPAERASMDEPLILDRYRLIERLASGGSAEVWRAHDEQLDRPVAVKRLHPHLLPDEASRRRLAAEARAAAGLSHPVVVGVYDVDTTGDWPALVMELVEGESLSARIDRDGPLSDREAAVVTADVAEALYHAHQRGVIHRDVKPGNVLLSTDGRTRLVDFGIAHSLAESAERLTVVGTVIGTLRAMAPEQLAGGPITPRTDLYGLGAVLHEALTGRSPYPTSSPVALAEAQRAGPPPLTGLDPALAAVIAACLAYDPADRPLHAGALAAALRDWLAGDPAAALAMAPAPGPAPAPSAVDTAAITQAIPVVAPPPRVTTPPPNRGRRSAALPIALLGALAGVVVIAAVVMANIGPDAGFVGADGSPTPAATPSSTPLPEWLPALVLSVEESCGPELAAQAESEMSLLPQEDAESYAAGLIDTCTDDGGGDAREKDKGKGNGKKGGDD